jgi:hypothetical protein
MSIHALALVGFDYYLTGQWDSLAETADEGVSLSDSRSYVLLRWPARFQQALLAAARGDSAKARAITDEMISWAVPRRAGAVHAYALHARALDAIGRGDFETAYRDACAISPAGTIASHVPHAMWMVLDLVEAAMRTGRRDEAMAHLAAAQETGLPAISARLALITLGARATTAADDEDATPSSVSTPGRGRNELAANSGLQGSQPGRRIPSGRRHSRHSNLRSPSSPRKDCRTRRSVSACSCPTGPLARISISSSRSSASPHVQRSGTP